jgi:hypothetical protein
MMNTVVKKFALAALCTTALIGLSGIAQAQVVFDIQNGTTVTPFDYSTAIGSNNVVNSVGVPGTGSTVFDPNTTVLSAGVNQTGPGSTWLGSSATLNAVLSVSGLTAGQNYTITWTYIGNEAGNQNTFSTSSSGALIASNSVVGSYAADNRNNNCNCVGGINPLPVAGMGATTYTNGAGTVSTPGFTLTDINTGAFVTNNGTSANPPPNGGAANLIFSYLTLGSHGFQWDLTGTPTNEILVGFNDNGSGDDNHDDFMFIATVTPGGNAGGTPIPGALPLFGSVIGGGFLFRKLKKRRTATA